MMQVQPARNHDGIPWVIVTAGNTRMCLTLDQAKGLADGISKAIEIARQLPIDDCRCGKQCFCSEGGLDA